MSKITVSRHDLVFTTGCRILDDLERGVDNTDAKLDRSMKRLKKFIRDTEGLSLWSLTIPFASS